VARPFGLGQQIRRATVTIVPCLVQTARMDFDDVKPIKSLHTGQRRVRPREIGRRPSELLNHDASEIDVAPFLI
jgi:hypothetical protein